MIHLPLLRSFVLVNFVCLAATAGGQQVQWTIVTPSANAITGRDNLYIQLAINNTYSYQEGSVQVLLDGISINPLTRINGNKLNLIYEGSLAVGKHHAEVKANIIPLGRVESIGWDFFVDTNDTTLVRGAPMKKERFALSGFLTADNRNESVTGSGQALRQEPSYTRTLTLDMAAKYKNVTIPVKLYTTTDKRFTQQTPNFYSVGFRNKWLQADFGDLNPALDRLVLTGIRMRGGRVQLKYRSTSLQLFYGYMSQSYEGRLESYAPGLGLIPSNLASDTLYIVPGSYRRWMAAARLENANKKGTYKIGFNLFKAKDDTTSIRYGLEPKDNIAAGLDATVKLFKKSFTINTGVAASVLTRDLKYGVVTNKYLDTALHVKTDFNPAGYDKFIVINSSTVPLSGNGQQFLAWYAQGIYRYKIQYLSVEYQRNGGGFFSLGNPFMRSNFKGVSVNEKISLWNRRISLSANFQKYSNNVNDGSALTNRTTIIGGNTFFTINSKYPSLFVSYVHQNRISENALLKIDSTSRREYTFDNLTASTNYSVQTGSFVHAVRATFNRNASNDNSRPGNKISFSYYSFGIGETFNRKYNITGDIGRTLLKSSTGDKFSDILTYAAFVQYILEAGKTFASLGISNNKNNATPFANESTRMSVIFRSSYRFYKGMTLYAEAGTQPYREALNRQNNFDEKYLYVRYLYDFDFK